MDPQVESLIQDVRARIDEKTDELTELCAAIVRVPSENPPGDTTGVVAILEPYLAEHGFETEVLARRAEMPNLIARWPPGARETHPNVVLNGHMDVFPVDPRDEWSFPPYGGAIEDGKILGEGAADMKGGCVASIAAATAVAELGISFPGQLTVTLVSDEEMGSRNGVAWLLTEYPELRGDLCLSGEPSGPTVIIYGERGVNDWVVSAKGVAGPGAAYLVGENAIEKLVKAIPVVTGLMGMRGDIPATLEPYLADAKKVIDDDIVAGASQVLEMLTLNIGLIKGGTNPAVTPSYAEMIINFRVPVGLTPYEVTDELRRRLEQEGLGEQITVEFMHDEIGINDALYTSPDHKLLATLQEQVTEVTGKPPRLTFGGGATDMRFYRRFGVPAVQYGPRSYPIFAACPDEFIYVQDLIDTAKVHAGTILRYVLDSETAG